MPAFPPVLGERPEILILGSMPGQQSLREARYYAHPQNSFWWMMARLIGFSDALNYQQKCHQLESAKFALWDVLYDCQREGSLDSNIQRHTEQVNDFAAFFEKNQSIRLIAFNGASAQQIFMRHCTNELSLLNTLVTVTLPSSSPAHARLNRQQKLDIWRQKLGLA